MYPHTKTLKYNARSPALWLSASFQIHFEAAKMAQGRILEATFHF
jgi:hypothetical protein